MGCDQVCFIALPQVYSKHTVLNFLPSEATFEMPIAETIAVISCICSIVGAMKAALELPGTMRKLKHAENGREVAPYLPARSIVQQSDYQCKNSLLLIRLIFSSRTPQHWPHKTAASY